MDEELLKKLYPREKSKFETFTKVGPTYTRPVVTVNDARNHFLTRYFVRSANDVNYLVEVNKKQYEQFKDNPRFVVAKVRWKIVGKKENTNLPNNIIVYGVTDTNRNTVANVDLTFTGLKRYIQDYAEFWVAETI